LFTFTYGRLKKNQAIEGNEMLVVPSLDGYRDLMNTTIGSGFKEIGNFAS